MNDEEIRDLEKEVRKRKRIASEWAAKLHDLVEEHLPAGWQALPEIAQGTLTACQAWEQAHTRLQAAQKE